MKLVILIVLASSAAAFAPNPLATQGVALNMAFAIVRSSSRIWCYFTKHCFR